MTHNHQSIDVQDSDLHLKIDPITRKIKNESGKTVLMQGDHNSERFTFEIPRYVDGHDMSLCNVVQVHYQNIDDTKTNVNSGIYEVDDLEISYTDDESVVFSWLISNNATKYPGTLNFVVHFACLSDSSNGIYDYSWDTDVYSNMEIKPTIKNSDKVVDEYADVLEKWRKMLLDINDTGLSNIDLATKETIAKIIEVGNDIIKEMDTKGDATLSQSWAVGGTGIRDGENTNNSWYWALESAKEAIKAKESAESIGNVEIVDNNDITGQGIGSKMTIQKFIDLFGAILIESIDSLYQVIPVTISASKWVGEAPPYTQDVSVPSMKITDDPMMVSLLDANSNETQQKSYMKAYGIISSGIGISSNGFVTFKVYEKTTTDITVGLTKLRGDI